MTGTMLSDEEVISDNKKKIINNIFNNINNVDGKYIKAILGSSVISEGITLENMGEVHIMDAYYNLGKIYQAIGRAIRQCKHYKISTRNNPNP
jgi:hypothetical protein